MKWKKGESNLLIVSVGTRAAESLEAPPRLLTRTLFLPLLAFLEN
jgi:hypothetical protein